MEKAYNLKEYAQFRIANEMIEMIRKRSETPFELFPLIVDSESIQVFSSLFNETHLPQLRISRVEKITLKRKAFPNTEAIYLISPSKESVNALI